jgi:hypothetical protein
VDLFEFFKVFLEGFDGRDANGAQTFVVVVVPDIIHELSCGK